MKKIIKISTVASAVAFTLASGIVSAESAAGYMKINELKVLSEGKGASKTLDFELRVDAPIPVDGKSGAFGYAALTDSGNNIMVAVTHLPIDDSSHEDPVTGFHTHVLDLKTPTSACQGASFEVDLENSGKNSAFDSDYKWKVDGNRITVDNVPVADLGDAGVEAVVSFTLKPVLDANNKPTNLCVTVVDKA
ncbi:hypothetical protein [Methylosarcina fibrata]|uniref:hypothetical protein n=1 Tax=Methylosarcina fibrata TaxID=105972 RepID=UPI00035D9724|nr:hypothetical protein [Methylosarcina fibrata]